MSIPTISLNHYLCINSLNLPEIRQNQRFDHPQCAMRRSLDFKLTGLWCNWITRSAWHIFPGAFPKQDVWCLASLFSYNLLWKSTVIIITRKLYLVEALKVVCVGLPVLTMTAGWDYSSFWGDRHLISTQTLLYISCHHWIFQKHSMPCTPPKKSKKAGNTWSYCQITGCRSRLAPLMAISLILSNTEIRNAPIVGLLMLALIGIGE